MGRVLAAAGTQSDPASTERARSTFGTRLGSATLMLSATTAAARGIGLGASLVVAHLLGARQLGVFALLTVAAAFLGAAGVLGFAPLCTRAVANAADPDEARAVVAFVGRTCATFLLLLGAGYLVLALVLPDLVDGLALPATGSLLKCVLVPIWGLSLGLGSVAQAVVSGHRAFAAVSVANLARAGAVGALSIGAAVLSHTASAAATGAVTGETLALLGLGWWVRRQRWLARSERPQVAGARRTRPLVRRLLIPRSPRSADGATPRGATRAVPEATPYLGSGLMRQALLSGIASLGIQLSAWVGQILVAHSQDGLVGSGAFLLASRLVLVVTLVPNALAASALPMLTRASTPHERAGLRRRATLIALCSTVPAALVMVLGAIVVLPLLDNDYLTYRSTVVLMGGVGIAMSANNLYGALALADGRFRAWIASDWVLAAALLVGALVLVPHFGTSGLAAAYLAAYAISVAVLVCTVRRPASGRPR